MVATGGGAYKYYDRLKEELDVNILREEEMECLIIGKLSNIPKYRGYSLTPSKKDWTFSSPKSPTKSSLTAMPMLSRCNMPKPGPMSILISSSI